MLYSTLYSIKKSYELSIHIIMIDPPSYLENSLKSSLDRLNKKYSLDIIDAEIKDLKNAKKFHGSLGPYLLFMGPHIVESEKVIYLDPDIIVLCDISELYNYNIGDKIIGAVGRKGLHRVLMKERKTLISHGINIDSTYYNTGVVLFNCKRYIELNIKNTAFKFINEHPDVLHTADQTVINIILNKRIYDLPILYNLSHRKLNNNPGLIYNNHGVFHYIGSPKPWDPFGYKVNSKADHFFKILDDTGFKPPMRWKYSFMRLKRLILLVRSYYNNRV